MEEMPYRNGSHYFTMTKFLAAIILSLLIVSCVETKPKLETTMLEFSAFSIETPKSWKKLSAQGIDSYVEMIAIDSVDSVGFDIGPYSWDLSEYDSIRWGGKLKYISNLDSSYSPHLYDSAEIYKVKKSTVLWDTINGYKAKMLVPVKSGIGYVGIYVDSLWTTKNSIYGKSFVTKFNLYGVNLKPENERAFLKAIRTLRFKK
jgi:hypothetical protein